MDIITEKSMNFAIRIVGLYKFLCNEKSEFVMSKQLLRSGTSIGANRHESEHAQSHDDFLHKNNIALKEASETKFWLELLYRTDYITKNQFDSMMTDCVELNRILAASIIKLKKSKG